MLILYSASVLFYALSTNRLMAQVAVNTTDDQPSSSAMPDVSATDKGMLIPRLTLAQRNQIATPETGLLIYQTDNTPGFYYWTSTQWVRMGQDNQSWGVTGNSGTSYLNNFIGTTDAQNFSFRTNNETKILLT